MPLRALLVTCLLSLTTCGPKTCPSGDLDCLFRDLHAQEIDPVTFEDKRAEEALTPVSATRMGALSAAAATPGSVKSPSISKAPGILVFKGTGDLSGDLLDLEWSDGNGCRPAFCMSPCPRGVMCSGAGRCSPVLRDGLSSGRTLFSAWFTAQAPEDPKEFDLHVIPVSSPGCSTSVLDALAGTGSIAADGGTGDILPGPEVVIPMILRHAGGGAGGGSGGGAGGGSGSCANGWMGSLRACTPLGGGGTCQCNTQPTNTCVDRTAFQSGTGLTLPASCNSGSGCASTSGTLVHPCCPGLTCQVGSACGGSSSGTGNCQ